MLRIYFISPGNIRTLTVGVAEVVLVQGSDNLFNLMKDELFIARIAFVGLIPDSIWLDEVFIRTLKEINV